MGWGHTTEGNDNNSSGGGSKYDGDTTSVEIIEEQYGTITDLVSVGEIDGLVGGLSGVYLNDTALLSKDNYKQTRAKNGTVSVTGSSISNAGTLFKGVTLSNGLRYIQIKNAGAASTLSSALSVGDNEVSTSSSFFLPYHINNYTGNSPNSENDIISHRIRIPGAGPNGTEYTGLAKIVSGSTSATLSPMITTAVSAGTAITLDQVSLIIRIDSDSSATLGGAVGVNQSSVPARLANAVQVYNSARYQKSRNTYLIYVLSQFVSVSPLPRTPR